MSSDQELDQDQLPKGKAPIWIEPRESDSQADVMARAIQLPELKQYNNNVTVLNGDKDEEVMDIFKMKGYKYIYVGNIAGVEDKVVILLNTGVRPELITRGINMLVIIER